MVIDGWVEVGILAVVIAVLAATQIQLFFVMSRVARLQAERQTLVETNIREHRRMRRQIRQLEEVCKQLAANATDAARRGEARDEHEAEYRATTARQTEETRILIKDIRDAQQTLPDINQIRYEVRLGVQLGLAEIAALRTLGVQRPSEAIAIGQLQSGGMQFQAATEVNAPMAARDQRFADLPKPNEYGAPP